MNRIILIAVIGLMCQGCASSRMTLKEIERDIPSALVKTYNVDSAPYVDEGYVWNLPLLFRFDEHVAKTEDGFQACQAGSLGLGLLLFGHGQSDFDSKGRLLEYEGSDAFLTGLLFKTQRTELRIGEVLKGGYGWSTLWGGLGFKKDPHGAKSLSLLWIPIQISRGEDL